MLRTGTASSGKMKMVLPLTCTVYWEAPMTVARMRALGSIIEQAQIAGALVHFLGDQRPEVAEAGLGAIVDKFRDAAGKHHAIDLAACS